LSKKKSIEFPDDKEEEGHDFLKDSESEEEAAPVPSRTAPGRARSKVIYALDFSGNDEFDYQ
jgi:hypothetical protein